MSGFWNRMFGRKDDQGSAKSAKERLQFVLVHDRINLPAERMQAMKQELMAVISKYVDVTTEEVEIALEQRDRNQNVMRAEIPFSKSLGADPARDEALEELKAQSSKNYTSRILDDDSSDLDLEFSDDETVLSKPAQPTPPDSSSPGIAEG